MAPHPVRGELRILAVVKKVHYDVGIMMTRTQLSFEREMLRRARSRAEKLGISLAEYVRRLVAADLEERRPPSDPAAVFDLGSSGGSDVSREKDAMVADAFSRDAR